MPSMPQFKRMAWLIDARPLIDERFGGVPRVTAELVRALGALHADATLALTQARTAQHIHTLAQSCGFSLLHTPLPNKLVALGTQFGLGYDRYFSTSARAVFFPNLEWIGAMRLPYAVLLHDLSFAHEPRWFPLRSRAKHALMRASRSISHASAIFTVSQRTARDAQHLYGVDASKIHVLPMGSTAYTSGSSTSASIALPKRYVMALGGNARKNIATAIEAVALTRHVSGYEDLELVIVGEPMKKTHEFVHAHGFLSAEDVVHVYSHTQALLYPSWYEGFGLPLHEATAFGMPSIASCAGALPETAPNGTVFCPPDKPHLWALALQQTLSVAKPAPHQTLDTWEHAAKRVMDVMDELSKSHKD